jgi:hypothetical protein
VIITRTPLRASGAAPVDRSPRSSTVIVEPFCAYTPGLFTHPSSGSNRNCGASTLPPLA